jgi:hypothetical protein
MPATLSWNEVRDRAIKFARDWAGETREEAEAKSFWDAFFEVFGKSRRTVATFEEPVKNIKGQYGYIDLFWRGKLLVEHKSAGKDLSKAHTQAVNYIQDLITDGRDAEAPRYILVSDFARFALHDLEEGTTQEFTLAALHKHVRAFAFIKGERAVRVDPEDPANLRAAEIMGRLHDALKDGGYAGHALERLLVRVLFCLFAEDTGIFEPNAFTGWIANHTREDGTDLGAQLARLFQTLDTPPERRSPHLDEDLNAFPYVNGELFREPLPMADFNRAMRNALLTCTHFDWSRISPAVFGSLFQSVMDPKERRQIGGHYTSERDILKLIRSLFLDDLRAEFETIKADRSTRKRARLEEFQAKLASPKFLDPACGCGNFLVITYRELRKLELEVLKLLHAGQQNLDALRLSKLSVDQMHGIELAEFPVRIAETALWLMDHQMNMLLSEAFGQYAVRLPLTGAPRIVCANALRMDWREVIKPEECSFILGNPPFVGAKFQGPEQRADLQAVAGDAENSGLLDYVTGWYFKAAEFIQGTRIVVGFVSTNSISQGEQVGTLWNALFRKFGLKIHFGHRTFPWASEARGKAHVHVVIIGFAAFDAPGKRIYDYEAGTDQATVTKVGNISPYLVEGPDMAITNRSKPLSDVPEIGIGNKPIDGGNYLFTPEQKKEFIKIEPASKPYFRRWIGSEEFINGIERWCLWLGECSPAELRKMPETMKRVEAVRKFRLSSKSESTRKIAAIPTRFHVENMPNKPFLVIPEVSSERRPYIPIGFMKPDILCSNLVKLMPHATLWHFAVLSSAMHMAWVRQVCGRLKSDYRYSNKLVYNNFPWPQDATEKQKAAVEAAAQKVLDVRKEFPGATLADLYDPLAMPPKLAKAHAALDKAVDRCYRKEPFHFDRDRVEHLFALYEKLVAPLIVPSRRSGRSRRRGPAA